MLSQGSAKKATRSLIAVTSCGSATIVTPRLQLVNRAINDRSRQRSGSALAEARRILELDPNFVAAHTLLASNVTKAPLPEALAFAEKGCSLAPWNPIMAGLLAGLLVKSGDRDRIGRRNLSEDLEMGGRMARRLRSPYTIFSVERSREG